MNLSTIIFSVFLFLFLSTEINAQIDSSETNKDVLEKAILHGCGANPFSSYNKIEYNIPKSANSARLVFLNTDGKIIKTVSIKHTGLGSLDIDPKGLEPGVYTYNIIVDDVVLQSKKFIVE